MNKPTQFTPGPWIVRRHEDSDTKDIRGASGEEIALCYAGDAALIAAAPAMYEALQQSLVLVELAALEEWGREVTGEQQPPTTEARDRLEKVKAALAQAEGQ